MPLSGLKKKKKKTTTITEGVFDYILGVFRNKFLEVMLLEEIIEGRIQ